MRRSRMTRRWFPMLMGGGAAPFVDPSSVDGMRLWCAADQLSLNDNDAVASFTDLSGNGYHPVCANAANKPTFKTNILNSLPALLFSGDLDANGDWLRVAFSNPQPSTMFLIFKLLTVRTESDIISGYAALKNTIKAGTADTNAIKAQVSATALLYNNAGVDEFAIWTIEFNGATSKIYKAGSLVKTADAGADTGDGMTIGARSYFAQWGAGSARENYNAHMYLAEVIIYDSVLSDAQRENVGGWLSEKYALNF